MWSVPAFESVGLSKSWSYLFTTYGYEDNASGSRNASSYPLSYVYSGIYYWATGRLYNQAVYSYYWSSTIYNSFYSYRLGMNGSHLFKVDTFNKRFGITLRCVATHSATATMNWSTVF